jgi:hypothetical protein
MGAPLHCYNGASGAALFESRGVGEAKQCCGVMVEATNSFRRHPTPYHMFTKCFSILICCGWTCGCTLSL